MEVVGVIALVITALVVLTVLVFTVISIPDIARYLRVRRM